MEVQFTPEQRAFVREAIESGRCEREEDAVKEALSLWEERERRRSKFWWQSLGPKLPSHAVRAAW